MARIYTRTGDKGETGLFGGLRVPKDSPRVEAYGEVDELNSVVGVVRALNKDAEIDSILESVQRDLFVVGADLATPLRAEGAERVPRVKAQMVENIEMIIDECQAELKPLTAFILPGGDLAAAMLHLARTVARRAERRVVTLSNVEEISSQLIPYLNRLSDLLFVLARLVNKRQGVSESEWHAL